MKTIVALLLGTLVLGGLPADNLSRDGFQSATLANGIPLYFKANSNNQVLSLQAFLRGGSVLLTKDTAGWEGLALTVLTRGSQKYTYNQVKDLLWRTTSSMPTAASSFDGSSFGLVALPESFDAVFDAWSDAWLHPSWDPTEFDRVLKDAQIALQQDLNDPYSRAATELHHAMFSGHPYAADFTPTVASLGAVTLDKLKAWWESNLKTGRIVLVAVGNFDFAKLRSQLDGTLGTLPQSDGAAPIVPPWTARGSALVIPFPDAGAVGYVRADFPIPAVSDPDYVAVNLGFTILNDILFDIVRAKYGACYSVWARSYGFLAPYGSLVVYKSQVPGKVRPYLEEAVGILASGKALAGAASASAAGKSGIGVAPEPRKASYVPVEQVLEFYKAKAINEFYEGQQTNGAIAGQMALALLYRHDAKAYLDQAARIHAVSAEDVVRVIKKYVQDAPKDWVALAAPDLLSGVDEATYIGK